jgi:hypothetical protein
MPYSINKYDGSLVANVEDGTVDNTLDISLIGRNYAGYGEVQNENIVHLLENFANPSEPPRKIRGQIWFDTANNKLKFYDGTKFRTTGGAEIGDIPPTGLTAGDFWYDTSKNQLFAWSGAEFILVGPQSVQNADTTGMVSVSMPVVNPLTNAQIGTQPVIQAQVNGAVLFIISEVAFTTFSSDIDGAVPGFRKIKAGITLVNTLDDGITTDDFYIWGTASNSEKLGGQPSSAFLSKNNNNIYALDVLTTFTDAGFTVGNTNNLKISIDNSSPVIKNQIVDGSIIFKTTISELGAGTSEKTLIKLQGTSLLPGVNSDGTTGCNIGSSSEKFNRIYSAKFYGSLIGTADQAGALYDGSSYRVGSVAATANTVAIRYADTNDGNKVTITSDKFEGLATRAANLNGGTAKSIPYQSTANTTAFLSPGTAKQVLAISEAGELAWTSLTSLVDTGQATQVGVTDTTITNTTHYLTFTSGKEGFQNLKIDSDSLTYNPNSNILTAGKFSGLATFAQYGDLAEKYLPDDEYSVGTVLMVGGDKEVTAAQPGFLAIGVVSEKPGYLMNSELEGGVAVALKGRVPVKVTGPVIKGQRLVASANGTAQSSFGAHTDTFAVALETNTDAGVKLVECIVL